MSGFTALIGIGIALLLGLFFVVASVVVPTPTVNDQEEHGATSTISSLEAPQDTAQLVATEKQEEIIITEKVVQTEKPPKPKSPPVVEVQIKPVTEPVPTALTQSESSALDASALSLRSALVNIICFAPAGGNIRSISGSGVFIDPKGIILTNAHIAQYLLLTDRNVSCTIRTGSPARDSFKASLIYLPLAWIKANPRVLLEQSPSGTGERDYALLAVTKSSTSSPLPESFSFIPIAINPPDKGTPVVIGTYGAQFLGSSQIQFSLFPTMVFGSVKDIFTFNTTTVDVIALGGSAAAQEGSSGGGVSSIQGELIGTITTSTIKGSTETRSLSAITSSYIRSVYASDTGEALDILLSKPTAVSVSEFASQIPALEAILTANLQ